MVRGLPLADSSAIFEDNVAARQPHNEWKDDYGDREPVHFVLLVVCGYLGHRVYLVDIRARVSFWCFSLARVVWWVSRKPEVLARIDDEAYRQEVLCWKFYAGHIACGFFLNLAVNTYDLLVTAESVGFYFKLFDQALPLANRLDLPWFCFKFHQPDPDSVVVYEHFFELIAFFNVDILTVAVCYSEHITVEFVIKVRFDRMRFKIIHILVMCRVFDRIVSQLHTDAMEALARVAKFHLDSAHEHDLLASVQNLLHVWHQLDTSLAIGITELVRSLQALHDILNFVAGKRIKRANPANQYDLKPHFFINNIEIRTQFILFNEE